MTHSRTEGTIRLDGLIEGLLPPGDDPEGRLQAWRALVRRLGLVFDLEIEGGTFSLLAATEPVPVAPLLPEPAERIREAVEQLVHLFPDPLEGRLVSTLRSLEFGQGEEIQTLYLWNHLGELEAHQRSVAAPTVPPPPALGRRDVARRVLFAVVAAAALVGLSSLFVDWRSVLESAWHSVTPLDVGQVAVDPGPFTRFLEVEQKERGPGSRSVVLTLRRTEAFPRDDEALAGALDHASGFRETLALEALARGYVRAEVYDAEGSFLGTSEGRVAGLREKDTVEVTVPVPRDPRPALVRLGP